MVYIETPHLLLRDWEEEDILPFVRMNSDKEVMEFFLTTLTEEETMAFYCRIRKEFEEYGYGLLLLFGLVMGLCAFTTRNANILNYWELLTEANMPVRHAS